MADNKKVCAIVGVGPGVGLAVVRRFAREGYQLALVARRVEALNQYVAELGDAGAKAYGYPADASDLESLEAVFDQINEQVGQPDVLVYNAAVVEEGKPSTLSLEKIEAHFRVNVTAALACAKQVIPHMKSQQRGTILFTGGGLALSPNPQYASLALSKAALRNLTYSLGAELEPEGIQVATVTIAGYVQPNTFFDPDLIAEKYWELHTQAPSSGSREIIYKKAD